MCFLFNSCYHQVIALYNASKRVSTIADHDNLFLFQVLQSQLRLDIVPLGGSLY